MSSRRLRWIARMARRWRRIPLVHRLALFALLPAALASMILVALLTRHQIDSLHAMANDAAQAIATETAVVAAHPMQRGDVEALQRIAHSVGGRSQVQRVRILGPEGRVLADQTGKDGEPASHVVRLSQPVSDPGTGRDIGTVTVDFSLDRAVAAQRLSVVTSLMWLAAVLLVAALIAWQEARWMSAPLRELAAAVRRLAFGDSKVSVRVTDDTEIGDVQRGFNRAAHALQQSQERMREEIVQATRELERKNTALLEASVAKARFLAAATHDLRQPLYALTLFSSALAVDEEDPARLDRIAHIQECVESLDHLFSELLDLSRLEAGAMQPDVTDFPIDEVFEEVSRNFRLLAEQRELRLITRPSPLWVHSDRTMLARVLNNLVSNALRYTERGGVLVGARRRHGHIRVDVWDTGLGIPTEHQSRVFAEFYRVDQAASHARSETAKRGLGLGLATVRKLTELLDVEITLKSRPGQGSLFSLNVPAAHAGAAFLPEDATPMIGDECADLAGLRVVVIDDEPAILSGLRYLLQSWECDVRAAEDREQALLAVADWTEPPDLVISDLSLHTDYTGLDAMHALTDHYRDTCTGNSPPFARLIITGETKPETLQPAMQAGLPMLFKPVAPEQLREAMAAALALQRPTRVI